MAQDIAPVKTNSYSYSYSSQPQTVDAGLVLAIGKAAQRVWV
jgi:hypothetical protein